MINPEEIKEYEKKIIDKLKTVFDPEIPINIYELGLIYDISITELGEAVVLMTLTAPNCPESITLPRKVEDKIKEIPGITNAKVLTTFDPPWDRSRLSESALLELGFL